MAALKPLIAYNNLFERGTLAADTEATGYEADNAADGFTNDAWKATASGNTWIGAFCASTQEVDCWGFYGSNLYVQGGTVKLQWSTDGTTWTDYGTVITPTHGGAYLQKVTALSKPFWRLYVNSPTVASYFTHVYVGKALSFERGIRAGMYTPNIAREVTFRDNKSEGGAFLGRSIVRQGAVLGVAMTNMTASYVRSYFEPFADYAQKRPFLFAWDLGDYDGEVAFCRLRSPAKASRNESLFYDAALDLECLLKPPTLPTAIPAAAAAVPAGLAAALNYTGKGKVDLSWSAATNAVYYKVYYSLTSGGPWTWFSTVSAPTVSATVTGLADHTTYYFAVTALNAALEESAKSTETSKKTIKVLHTFTGADSTTDIGTADTGHTFSTFNSYDPMGISSNKAYCPGTSIIAGKSVDSGLADGTVRGEAGSTLSIYGGLAFRIVDDNNFWFVWHDGVNLEIHEKTAGVITMRAGAVVAIPGNGDVLSVVLSGTAISARINGTEIVAYTSASHQSATKHGLTLASTDLMDNFAVHS